MKYILTVLISTILFGCNQTPKKEIPGVPYNPMDYQTTTTYSVYEAPYDTTRLLMTAKDNNNSWLCNFYSNRMYLLTNNLKDTFLINNDLYFSIKNKNLLFPYNLRSKDSSFILDILPESCQGETSDEILFSNVPKKIKIKYKRKIYSGCVTLIDTTLKN